MDFLNDRIKPIYLKYLAAAFGSAMITLVYSIVDMAMVGQYHGPEGTAAVIGAVALAVLAWITIWSCERPILTFFGADESLLVLAQRYMRPIKWVFPLFLFNQMLAAFLRNDRNPVLATLGVLLGGAFNVLCCPDDAFHQQKKYPAPDSGRRIVAKTAGDRDDRIFNLFYRCGDGNFNDIV